ncbi:M36 family metallopeptidase [Thalassotalea fonticola]|uniref:M36 family metallopeptidase n=1 Tax=Thalassotalea fonticola TaxID=3065649 RepID=A0ABZ0GUH5_9GAMM|nr:M36 family metallopeptidase [Colwelliaceae bacterium S1-1]
MPECKKLISVNTLFGFVLVAVLSITSSYVQAVSSNSAAKGNPATFLTGPNAGKPLAIARRYIDQNKGELGLSNIDIAGMVVTNQYTSSHNGVTHIYFQQHYQGIGVHNASININIAADGSVINLGNRFMASIDTAVNSTLALVPRGQAISAAAKSLGIDPNLGPISRNPIQTKLVYQPVAKNMLRLAWDMEIYELDAKNWWSMRVDAINGAVLDRKNYVAHEVYEIYPVPLESPNHGVRDYLSMPIGTSTTWVSDQCTSGNNVDAYLDTDNSNSPTGGNNARACNSGLDFSFSLELFQEPNQYQDAAVTNLFYWNNIIHDVFYQYGFDENSGNFQNDNSDNGGLGNDAVNAEAQDGGGTNNANFATPPDGQAPRMQMYLWNQTSPMRDGDLDNGIIVHEYGHGISNRLTGGPSAATCLNNTEQAGEGWSDYFALIMTIEAGDEGSDSRGIGTYVLGESIEGDGIRDYPYSTDMSIDPRTYDSIKTAAVPHGVGSTWAAMLWQMTWALINEHGFELDLYTGSGGNNIALQLVIDGLKMQPCSPGFVDARNAILLADQNNNAGANQCIIWEAFAERGLGFSAEQGSASNRSDGIEAFDVPLFCQEILKITTTSSSESVEAGATLTYYLQIENNTPGSLSGVTVTNPVPNHTSYINGSATCGGSLVSEIVTFPIGDMAIAGSQNCSFEVIVDSSAATPIVLDDMESGSSQWIINHGSGTDDWSLSTESAHSPVYAAFAEDIATSTDQYLTLNSPVELTGDAILKFWHHYDTEANWDGGVVEISINGVDWDDAGQHMYKGPYNSTITSNPASAISGRKAFSGNSGGYIQTNVDLSSYAGETVQIRFRMATDGLVGGVGWYIDDVEIIDDALLSNQACVTAIEGDNDCDTVHNTVTSIPAPHIAVNPASLSSEQGVDVETFQALIIANTGSELLTWSIETDTADNCLAPDNISLSWASVSPIADSTDGTLPNDVTVTFNSTGLALNEYNGVLCIYSNDSVNSPLTVPLTLTVYDPSATTEQQATAEIANKGVITGTFVDTHVDDGASEEITEVRVGGNRDKLLHTWSFQLDNGTGLEINANAWMRNDGGDGETIQFSYSSDNSNYIPFYTLSSTSSSNTLTVPIPDHSAGAFYLRVEDTDRTKGNNNNASLFVDYLAIYEGSVTEPPEPPEPPQPTEVAVDIDLSGSSEIRNKPSRWDAIITVSVMENNGSENAVESAVISGNWSNGTSGSGSCTTEADGTCTIKKANLKQNVSSVTFTFGSIEREGNTFVTTVLDNPVEVNQ